MTIDKIDPFWAHVIGAVVVAIPLLYGIHRLSEHEGAKKQAFYDAAAADPALAMTCFTHNGTVYFSYGGSTVPFVSAYVTDGVELRVHGDDRQASGPMRAAWRDMTVLQILEECEGGE